jgi:hypothetical protein
MIRVKRVFDKIFKGVNSLEESDLSENQPISNPFASIIEPINFPPESYTSSINAASSSGHAAILEHDDGNDSKRTPSPSPHQTKNDSVIRQETNNEESQQPTPNQQNPQTPIPSSEHTSPPPEHHNSPIPEHQPTPQPENTITSDDVVETHPLRTPVNDVDNSPQHVDDINTSAMDTPLKERFYQLHKDLFSETTSSPQNLQALMQNLSDNCIVARLDLPSRISNEPLSVSQDDITKYLCAVDKNMRRMTSAIANRSIDDGHVETEFDLMESTFLYMIRSAKVAYRKDLAFRIEMARKEEKRD